MNLKFYKNLNILKTAGITNFFLVDIHYNFIRIALFRKKERILNLQNSSDFKIELTELKCQQFDSDTKALKKLVLEIAEKNEIKDIYLFAGISDFQYANVAIPLETDDIHIWFLENSLKFLPEGKSVDEFVFAHELQTEDENNGYYSVAIARRDNIERLYNSLSDENIKIPGVFPFALEIPGNKDITENTSYLLLDVLNGKIDYTYRKSSNVLTHGKLYQNNTSDNIDAVKDALLSIKQNVLIELNDYKNLTIYFSCENGEYNEIREVINAALPEAKINPDIEDSFVPFIIGKLFTDVLFQNYEGSLNLLQDSQLNRVRTELEKQSVFRYIITSGMLIILLLISAYIWEGFLTGEKEDIEARSAEMDVNKTRLEQVTKQNKILEANLRLLNSLKGSKINFTDVLYYVSDVMPQDLFLTDIKLEELPDNKLQIHLEGISKTQKGIASLIENLELAKVFREITLDLSETIKREYLLKKVSHISSNPIFFTISAEYYAKK